MYIDQGIRDSLTPVQEELLGKALEIQGRIDRARTELVERVYGGSHYAACLRTEIAEFCRLTGVSVEDKQHASSRVQRAKSDLKHWDDLRRYGGSVLTIQGANRRYLEGYPEVDRVSRSEGFQLIQAIRAIV